MVILGESTNNHYGVHFQEDAIALLLIQMEITAKSTKTKTIAPAQEAMELGGMVIGTLLTFLLTMVKQRGYVLNADVSPVNKFYQENDRIVDNFIILCFAVQIHLNIII